MPKQPRSLEDEESTQKNELKKAYERISILETRVHDLTLQATLVRTVGLHCLVRAIKFDPVLGRGRGSKERRKESTE